VPDAGVATTLRDDVRRGGPITFERFQAAALDAYFAGGGGAGRAGRDFVTSPEVGTLYGALVATALDATWRRLDEPDPFVVVDAGGGRGQLLADVLRARPACAPALRAVLVERSPRLRAEARDRLALEPPEAAIGAFAAGPDDTPQPVRATGPIVTALDDLPDVAVTGVIVANELLDNLPVRLVEARRGGWREVRVGLDDEGRFVELPVDAPDDLVAAAAELVGDDTPAPGARLPIPVGADDWLTRAGEALRRGELWVVDYADETAGLLARGPSGRAGWLRTYRGHGPGSSPLDAPGTQDVTTDVPLAWLRRAAVRSGLRVARETSQADWLRDLGVAERAAEGQARWEAGAHRGDLDAVAGRSRALEAAALTDPSGLGAHRVAILTRG
jgi:SAM-dependent MidA family methyltransferase